MRLKDSIEQESTYWDPRIPWRHAHDPPRFLREDECPPWWQDSFVSEKEEYQGLVEGMNFFERSHSAELKRTGSDEESFVRKPRGFAVRLVGAGLGAIHKRQDYNASRPDALILRVDAICTDWG